MLKVGLFGIGLDTYWDQFEGLLDRLMGYQSEVKSLLETHDVEVVDTGMVDNPFKAKQSAMIFSAEDVDCIFLFISTYALSQNVLPIAQKVKVPVIVLNLQPVKAIDYKKFNGMGDRGKMTGEWLAHCQSCVAPELSSVFNRAGIDFYLISGYLQEDYVASEISDYLVALKVVKGMRENRVGVMGHYYNGMLDVYSDLTQQSSTFGNHFEIIEFGMLKKLRDEVGKEDIENKIEDFRIEFKVSTDCDSNELIRAAKTAVALDKLVEHYQLGSLAYYYEGNGDTGCQDIVTSLIPGLTLLTGKNVPVAGEYEIKNVQAMKMLDLMGVGGSFSEFYAMDFEEDIMLLGHDGPAHFSIAEGKVGLVPLPVYHGKPGKGLSIQMEVKNGPVTLLSVAHNRDGEIFLICAEGASVSGDTLQIGNTNSRYKFPIPIRDFIDKWSLAGPSHHCAIGMGHKAAQLKKLAQLLKIKLLQIC
ncbi:L-fucose/L-arabinose isomerase family protein [Allomuricauda sp. ARW1Y1]|jgi:L-arabinose isomerase|uniref:L-fucose/L-arabinose isomerase family protein n=1 Tax=Allomuricauda sp. ARW1Y1 TaxID=2663843 RepID=UPI0015CAA4E4|nr:L-fucose/L-arabinose isomerase family protein [Muricauda sp. ARW1Y1]NYJ27893.1 L-arabinose isomerase [Muricauda sp. ARW1Y1]